MTLSRKAVTGPDQQQAYRSTVWDFLALLKPRVMALVVFTGWIGLLEAPERLHPVLSAVTLLCIALASGAAGALNMWYDRDIDAVMKRTCNRPLPCGKISGDDALTLGVMLLLWAICLMGVAVNWLAAGLLAFASGFYVLVYTMWLKRLTPHNIIIGGLAGAMPPTISWAAATGRIGLPALMLSLVIFVWTPPHFWALALGQREDYRRARVPMLPVIAGVDETKRQILIYTILLWPLPVVAYWLGIGGYGYLVSSVALGGVFVVHAYRLLHDATSYLARATFRFSIVYLFVLFAVPVIEQLWPQGL